MIRSEHLTDGNFDVLMRRAVAVLETYLATDRWKLLSMVYRQREIVPGDDELVIFFEGFGGVR